MDLERLTSLARAVALDPELQVERGPHWCYAGRSHHIEVAAADLEGLPEDELRGLLCHEAAHAALTRYPVLVPQRLLDDLRVSVVLNALEDCRIEDWLLTRLPGTRPWLEQVNARLFPGDDLRGQPPVLQFALGLIHSWWHGEPPPVQDEVLQALGQTAPAVRRLIQMHPRPGRSARAERVFRRVCGVTAVSAHERQVRAAALSAWELAWSEILPVALALGELPHDVQPLQRFVEHTAMRLDPIARPEVRERTASRPPSPVAPWSALRAEVLPEIDALTTRLEALLAPERAPRWRQTRHRGQRVDLRAAMQRAARPETPVWQDKSLPERREARFLLLVDLSGSMHGARIQAALRGVVVLTEVLERLGIRYAVHGFQDTLIRLQDFGMPLDPEVLLSMPLEVAGVRPDGHNQPAHNHDGPAVAAAGALLRADGGRTPVLLVVSDGEPSGPADGARHLHEAVAGLSGIRVVGLGLGEGTAAVARFYPHHAVDLPLSEFGAGVADAMHGALA